MAKERILIIDDDPEMIASLGRTLRASGYTTVSAPDAETGLLEIAKERPAVIISDVQMPGINGFQLCRQLRASAATQDLPVILMSGKTDPADHFWAKEVGARVLLRKPIEVSKLVAEVAGALAPAP